MQVEHKTEKGTVLFVKVPEVAKNFKIRNNYIWFDISEILKNACYCLPEFSSPGEWKIIGLTSETSEGQSKMMVDCPAKGLYANYDLNTGYLEHLYGNPLDSFKSLMHRLQINESEKWIVLFKEN